MAVVNTINNDCNLNLIESDVVIISVNSMRRYHSLRRVLVAALNFKYIINTTIKSTSVASITSSLSNAVSTGSFVQNIINSRIALGSSYTGTSSFAGLSISQPTVSLQYISTHTPTLSPTILPSRPSNDKIKVIIAVVISSVSLILLTSLLLAFYYRRRKVLVMHGVPLNEYKSNDIVTQLQQIIPGVLLVKQKDHGILVYFDSNTNAKTSMTVSSVDSIKLYHHQITFRWSYHLSSLLLLLSSSSSSSSSSISISKADKPVKPDKPDKPNKHALNIQSLSSFQAVSFTEDTDDVELYIDHVNHYDNQSTNDNTNENTIESTIENTNHNNIENPREKMIRLLEENKRLKNEIEKLKQVAI